MNSFEYDYKGNIIKQEKQFAEDYENELDWNNNPTLINETFIQETTYDALNRPTTLKNPDNKTTIYGYDKGGLLVSVKIDTNTPNISNIEYNEKQQRLAVYYGNNTKTKYEYNPLNFRLTRILTTRNTGNDALQDLNYSYDAVGNIIQQTDNAQQTFYFNNAVITPTGTYEYDALYRLLTATGRENGSLNVPTGTDIPVSIPVPYSNNSTDLVNYTQNFVYDKLGNIQSVSNLNKWTRDYVYDSNTNRLLKHDTQQTADDYEYDAHGNMLYMPGISQMEWDYLDQLQKTISGNVTSYYNYDSEGNRTRKVVEKQGGIKEIRYYINDYEVYRKEINNTVNTERITSHIRDDQKRFVLIDTLTIDNGNTLNTPTINIRYQFDNHLGSASLELDETGNIISYEEYHPFGTSSYRLGRNASEVQLKRYRYVGKERDEETGLYYYGARYYAAWICRFVSIDPLQFEYPELTPFQYASNRPITMIDLDGLEGIDPNKSLLEYKEIRPFEADKTRVHQTAMEPHTYSDSSSNSDRTASLITGILNIAAGLSITVTGLAIAAGTAVTVGGAVMGVTMAMSGLAQMGLGIAQTVDAAVNKEPVVPAVGGVGELIGNELAEKTGNIEYRFVGAGLDFLGSKGFSYKNIISMQNIRTITSHSTTIDKLRAGVEITSDFTTLSSLIEYYSTFSENSNSFVDNNGDIVSFTYSINELFHLIQPGETLSSIAKLYGTTVDELVNMNDIEDPNLIYANDYIKINQEINITITRDYNGN